MHSLIVAKKSALCSNRHKRRLCKAG